mmetsp:Transcript_16870/g.34400  ORF Transcript_16870/g.34400 Transcript_16870/m.34400 type:complete len:260 (-) Transcript_16870:48-827(-)
MISVLGIHGFSESSCAMLCGALACPDVEIAAVNCPFMDLDYMAYRLQRHTAQKFPGKSVVAKRPGVGVEVIDVEGTRIRIFHESSLAKVPWNRYGVDFLVLDSLAGLPRAAGASLERSVASPDPPLEIAVPLALGGSASAYLVRADVLEVRSGPPEPSQASSSAEDADLGAVAAKLAECLPGSALLRSPPAPACPAPPPPSAAAGCRRSSRRLIPKACCLPCRLEAQREEAKALSDPEGGQPVGDRGASEHSGGISTLA